MRKFSMSECYREAVMYRSSRLCKKVLQEPGKDHMGLRAQVGLSVF